MPIVWIPSLLRDLTAGNERVVVPGSTVGEIIHALDQAYPGVAECLCDAGTLRSAIAVVVDNQIARKGLDEPVAEKSEVHFLPAISGGS